MSTTWDRIYTINDYYDGPERGVADLQGTPRIYQKLFSKEDDEYTNRFLLSKIDLELLALVMENWNIWLRWNAAYRQGKVNVKTHPALPEERQRHEEQSLMIGDRFKPDPETAVVKWARFRHDDRGELEVEWLDAPPETS
jgi:hypothetical protein